MKWTARIAKAFFQITRSRRGVDSSGLLRGRGPGEKWGKRNMGNGKKGEWGVPISVVYGVRTKRQRPPLQFTDDQGKSVEDSS